MHKPVAETRPLAQLLFYLYLGQLAVGFINFVLMAPTVLQIIHLAIAVALFAVFTAASLVTLGYPLAQQAAAKQPLTTKLENA